MSDSQVTIKLTRDEALALSDRPEKQRTSARLPGEAEQGAWVWSGRVRPATTSSARQPARVREAESIRSWSPVATRTVDR
ncbi:hypothetical protein ACFV4M_09070 [Kitasatospora indigofera]|uniref:hypothetical protein n=1 Tax=Kitasatospora indigofera TaxID=67307 RepID=UPI00365937F0